MAEVYLVRYRTVNVIAMDAARPEHGVSLTDVLAVAEGFAQMLGEPVALLRLVKGSHPVLVQNVLPGVE